MTSELPQLATDRLLLRPLRGDGDVPFLRQLLSDPEGRSYLGGALSGANLDAAVSRYLHMTGVYRLWLVEASGAPIGVVFLCPHQEGGAELSYQFLPQGQGTGFAAEAKQAVLGYARAALGLSTIVAETQAANMPSLKLLRKLGFVEARRLDRFGARQVVMTHSTGVKAMRKRRRLSPQACAVLFLTPTILGLLLFRLVPMVWAFGLSFTHWKIFDAVRWAGFENYISLVTSPTTLRVFVNTAYFMALYVPGVVALALLLAVILNRAIWGAGLFRSLYFLPYITTTVAVALTWRWMYSTRFGLINSALDWVGISENPAWLGDPAFAMPALAIVAIWRDAGFYMLLLLAGLQTIDDEVYEAARIDGARTLRRFWTITVPLLSRSLFFVLIIAMIRATQTFELTFGLTEGGPNGATVTLGYQIYLDAFVNFEMGQAAALSYTLAILLGFLTLVNFRLRKWWVHE